ncbi:hypothetical protein PB1_14389 [Bacillus methanolicus PB1]|uniref:TIGR00375 family protein n=1 Tax=Bacillus methanolicus PB1 TaxID=997296 RepID=I3DWY3_BACMT|nr:endonuclease Q family protein [Bacillus methanolicus]EIJ78754.1 hypothetical protein PB1_14389 [Bacillus methanolicus PB1]
MNLFYVDLHIHIGRTQSGKAVKITGAKSLTFTNMITHARDEKGLNMIGVIDCHSPEVLEEMHSLLEQGYLTEYSDGGLMYDGMAIIPGSELEVFDANCKGPIHVLCFFSGWNAMSIFSRWLKHHVKNINLSSQRIYVSGKELQHKVKELGGLFIPAHVFTPFKSLYGSGVERSLAEAFYPDLIDGIELGLSADTSMADQLGELHEYPFLTNSDAHSLGKIAREYQIIQMNDPSFAELRKALQGEGKRKIIANYGMDPLLGKYHQTVCAKCFSSVDIESKRCSHCGHSKIIKGVSDRIHELKTAKTGPKGRPPYIHQVPLEFIPGLGLKLRAKLLGHFGTEMAILHEVPFSALKEVVPEKIATFIMKARAGELTLQAGGGGKYGRISE